jgi:ketosteroid isomerase-like protein
MKKLLLLLLVVTVLPFVHASTRASDPSSEIRAVMDAQVAAWNRGDIDGFMDGYVRSDTLEFVSAGKTTRGWQTVRDRYHKKYTNREAMGTLTFSEIKINLLNTNHAHVQGRWSLQRKTDRPHGTFNLIFRHTPVGWLIARDETL